MALWHTLRSERSASSQRWVPVVDRDEQFLPPEDSSLSGEQQEERAGELDRVISLSDGVFAFAMTLLIVGVEVPNMTDDEARVRLHHDVVELWPQVLSYVIGFLVIGFLWTSHRRIFSRVADFDDWLTRLNILLLMMVAFLPFPTSLMGEYGVLAFPAIFYSLVLAAISVLYVILIDHLDGHRELMTRSGRDFDFARFKTRHFVTGSIFLLSIPVSLAVPGYGQVLWVLLAFNHPITEWLLPHLPERLHDRGHSQERGHS
jgi:uncharacterized membrane protein